MLQAPPPVGPRATRTSGRTPPSRVSSRGGIQKKGSKPARVDRDGDVKMGITSTNHNAIRGTAKPRRHESTNTKVSARSNRTGIDTTELQKTVLQNMGAENKALKGSRPRGVNGKGRTIETREPQERIKITGWKQSKAAANPDGGLSDLIAFLERKATHSDTHAGETVKIKKSRIEGDALIISIRLGDSPKILKLNNFSFAGATLHIELTTEEATLPNQDAKSETTNTVEILKGVLARRYNVNAKLLDLSQLGADLDLVNLGIFATTSSESKFFPALMKICDNVFTTQQQKDEAVLSVTLANNSLPNITSVTTLAQTFPSIKNLDLSNNQLKDLTALEGWRWKFRKLDHLVLSGNPIEGNQPTYKDEVLKWFPRLTTLNNIQIRTPEQVKSAANGTLPLPILPANFQDEASIGENFVKQFFETYDQNRTSLAGMFYDTQSTFSLSVNTSAPRVPISSDQNTPGWEAYIKKSRNLTKIGHLPTRLSRLYTGTDAIRECFATLPATRHPDLATNSEKWCIECHTLPGLPDPRANIGVGGLLIMVHSQFAEINLSKGNTTVTRSFDRTFALGPGGGVGGIRIICDTLLLRSYGGDEAWRPELSSAPRSAQSRSQVKRQTPIPAGFAMTAPGKSAEQVQKESILLEFSKGTGMTLEYSQMCLEQSEWNLEGAALAFQQAKANLPADAFVAP